MREADALGPGEKGKYPQTPGLSTGHPENIAFVCLCGELCSVHAVYFVLNVLHTLCSCM